MSILTEIFRQIKRLTEILVGLSLCDHSNFPAKRDLQHGYCEIGISGHTDISYTLKNVSYHEIYTELVRTQTYNLKMLDGALVQMLYRFKDDIIESHRLAFFPSPTLEEFQNNPEIYLEDEIFSDIIAKNIVPFPLRFDFDTNKFTEVEHPKSHVTLGQYKNCRIPATSPLMPCHFILFILRNFYNTAFLKYSDKIKLATPNLFTDTITTLERKLIHIQIPND
jgi:hypothetical protein